MNERRQTSSEREVIKRELLLFPSFLSLFNLLNHIHSSFSLRGGELGGERRGEGPK